MEIIQCDIFGNNKQITNLKTKNTSKDIIDIKSYSISRVDKKIIVIRKADKKLFEYTARGVVQESARDFIFSRLIRASRNDWRNWLPGKFFKGFMTDSEIIQALIAINPDFQPIDCIVL